MITVAQKTDIQRKVGESGFKSWRERERERGSGRRRFVSGSHLPADEVSECAEMTAEVRDDKCTWILQHNRYWSVLVVEVMTVVLVYT